MEYQFNHWSSEMLKATQAELTNRVKLLNDLFQKNQELLIKEEEQLKIGKQAIPMVLVIGWLTVLGLFGILIGYNYKFSKVKSDFSGETCSQYNETSRRIDAFLFYTFIRLSYYRSFFICIGTK